MVKKQPNINPKTGTQYKGPNQGEQTIELLSYITEPEKEYIDSFIGIVSKLELDDGNKILKDNTISEFIRTCMTFMTNWYMHTAFMDSTLINKFTDKQAKKDFIAFRTKYMKIPVDAQLNELKRLGILNAKKG